MIARTVLTAVLLAAALAAPAPADRLALDAGTWWADNGQDEALVWGPEASWIEPAWTVRARLREGVFNAGGDIEDLREWRVVGAWRRAGIEVGAGAAGFAFHTELQPGWSWSYETERAERNADIAGPVLFAGVANRDEAAAFGWRAGATWMPVDLGDFADLGYDGAHIDLEVAVHVGGPRVRVGAGYRYVRFADLPHRAVNEERLDREVLSGLAGFLSFRW